MEFGYDLSSFEKGGNASLDGGDCDRFRLRERIPPDRHETSDRSGRWDPVKIFDIGFFRPPSPCCPFADNAEGASEAACLSDAKVQRRFGNRPPIGR